MSKLLAIIGFLVLALSPSFIDLEQSPEYRKQIFAYYFVAVIFIWFGMDGWIHGQ